MQVTIDEVSAAFAVLGVTLASIGQVARLTKRTRLTSRLKRELELLALLPVDPAYELLRDSLSRSSSSAAAKLARPIPQHAPSAERVPTRRTGVDPDTAQTESTAEGVAEEAYDDARFAGAFVGRTAMRLVLLVFRPFPIVIALILIALSLLSFLHSGVHQVQGYIFLADSLVVLTFGIYYVVRSTVDTARDVSAPVT